ncbi:alpha-glucosidase/alpha-galactosidase [Rubellicoccus peritrichatus]|uniref:Alpha-glucosidase/alpha-galactosidase n=2 Tax=Rubellicoccus peritrichatus TaxID=3080537 RepID=A0AAQ3QWT6_9BACT|nr:alpha-glucosidase/alpha-galactosidase [Puniceicoccus sp. CR14]WOO42227.1 alpha-glucosidase/alpha-galactosidase [Puniceicoccus sp. CR14]
MKKITFIGAGSIGFTRRLVADILTVPEMADTLFAFTDISKANLDMVTQLCRRDIKANKLPAKIQSTTNRRKALTDADYVFCVVRQGGLEAFQTDIEIPLQYGVDQCVGDTLCAGGIMYGQRTIHTLLEFCRDIREVSKPGAMFLNYSNPMAMNTWACNKYGGVKTIGLCHGVQGAHHQITKCTEIWAKKKKLISKDVTLSTKDVDVIAAGLNHQTWFTKAEWNDIDLIPIMLELFEGNPEYVKTEKVRIDVLKRFGYYSTESNGHLSEYLPWYRKRAKEIPQWIDLGNWINGETGGYLRACTESRNWFEHDFPNWMKADPWEFTPGNRSEEHGSYILEGLETGRIYRGHFNVMNDGVITNLPDECCIEVPGYVDKTGIQIPVVGDLPLACAATCSVSARVQQMSVEAAVHGDVNLLKQAMLHDPLTGAVCNPEEIWQMTDDMLIAQQQWLPQYKSAIPAAKKRLTAATRNKTRVKLLKNNGAARLKLKSVDQMQKNAEEHRAMAAASDKGNMTKGAMRKVAVKRKAKAA